MTLDETIRQLEALEGHEPADVLSDALTRLRAMQWQPISNAPHGRPVLVSYVNELGKRRRVKATFYELGTLQMGDECPDHLVNDNGDNTEEGWYEESESHETILPVNGVPDIWIEMPALPPAPVTERP
jgi:hypothetical protein